MPGVKRTGPASSKRPSKRQKVAQPATASSRGSSLTLTRLPKVEIRRNQQTAWAGDLSTGGDIGVFGTVPAGDNNWQRNGRVIKHLYFQWHADITKYASASFPTMAVRIIFGLWFDDSTPNAFDILGAGGADPAYIKSDYNQLMAGEYKILSDKLYNLESNSLTIAGTNYAEDSKQFMGVIKCQFEQKYGSGPDPSDVLQPRHFVLVITDRPYISTNPPGAAEISCSVTYVDV